MDGQCVPCTNNCDTCQTTPDYCLTCKPGFYFHQNKCLANCPKIGKYQYVPNRNGQCIIDGLICKFGYEVSPNGDACILLAAICEPPQTLNYDKTKCIPGSEDYVLFPVMWVALVAVLLVVLFRAKSKLTKFVPNMIIFLSPVEKISFVVFLIEAISFGIKPVVYLMAVAIVFSIAIDIFFLIVFTQQIKLDESFKYWCLYNPKVVSLI